jgi:hypothetical protein
MGGGVPGYGKAGLWIWDGAVFKQVPGFGSASSPETNPRLAAWVNRLANCVKSFFEPATIILTS